MNKFSHSAEADAGRRGRRGKPTIAEMYSGWWTRRKTTGEAIGSKMRVLIKPVTFLSEREREWIRKRQECKFPIHDVIQTAQIWSH